MRCTAAPCSGTSSRSPPPHPSHVPLRKPAGRRSGGSWPPPGSRRCAAGRAGPAGPTVPDRVPARGPAPSVSRLPNVRLGAWPRPALGRSARARAHDRTAAAGCRARRPGRARSGREHGPPGDPPGAAHGERRGGEDVADGPRSGAQRRVAFIGPTQCGAGLRDQLLLPERGHRLHTRPSSRCCIGRSIRVSRWGCWQCQLPHFGHTPCRRRSGSRSVAVSDAAIIGTAGFVAVAAMYLYFCWKVYNRSGDIHALEVAVKLGLSLGLRRFDAPPREAATEHIELPPARGAAAAARSDRRLPRREGRLPGHRGCATALAGTGRNPMTPCAPGPIERTAQPPRLPSEISCRAGPGCGQRPRSSAATASHVHVWSPDTAPTARQESLSEDGDAR